MQRLSLLVKKVLLYLCNSDHQEAAMALLVAVSIKGRRVGQLSPALFRSLCRFHFAHMPYQSQTDTDASQVEPSQTKKGN
jgi:hypothetical protein